MSELNNVSAVNRQYASANHLNTRISIHDKYSTNKMGFGKWIASNYRIEHGMKVLELGCGTGEIWKGQQDLIAACSKLILSDLSEGMLQTARDHVGGYDHLEYKKIDIQDIPYENEIFDVVIANMMLYHVPDINKGLCEVRRVLKKNGHFYCATFGEYGIMEYLSKILFAYGFTDHANKGFTLQNGTEILGKVFTNIEKLEYTDSLEITDVDDMVEYIFSMSNMTTLNSVSKDTIKGELTRHMKDGVLSVPKEYGMFIAS